MCICADLLLFIADGMGNSRLNESTKEVINFE